MAKRGNPLMAALGPKPKLTRLQRRAIKEVSDFTKLLNRYPKVTQKTLDKEITL